MSESKEIQIFCKYDKLVDPKSLKEHPKNRNKHPKEQVKRLAKLIKFYGIRHPIILDADEPTTIIVGRGRQLSMIEAGVELVPVVYQKFDNQDQKYGFIQADNAIGDWSELDYSSINYDVAELGPDFDIELLGIENFEIDVADKYGDEADNVPAPPVEPITKPGDLWKLGEHRLLCGDSTNIADVEKLMGGNKAQTFFTDPPYGDNVGGLRAMTGNEKKKAVAENRGLVKRDKFIKNDLKIDWLRDVFNLVPVFMEPESTKMVFFKWDKYEQIKAMAECFGEPSALCVWDRVRKASAFFRFQPQHEFCFHWGNQADKKDKSSLSNVWRVPKEKENNELHPTVKPIDIIEPAITVTTEPNKIVLDLFAGSGSTLIACEKSGRLCYTMELDPAYCDVVVKRFENLTGQKAVLLNG